MAGGAVGRVTRGDRIGAGRPGRLGGDGEDIGEQEEASEVVALTEVARRKDAGDDDEAEEQGGAGRVGKGGADAAQVMPREVGDGGEDEDDEEFGPGGGGVEEGEGNEGGEANGDCRQPDDEGRVAVEALRAVEGSAGEPAPCHEQEPELIVAGGGEQGEEDGHGERAGGEGVKDVTEWTRDILRPGLGHGRRGGWGRGRRRLRWRNGTLAGAEIFDGSGVRHGTRSVQGYGRCSLRAAGRATDRRSENEPCAAPIAASLAVVWGMGMRQRSLRRLSGERLFGQRLSGTSPGGDLRVRGAERRCGFSMRHTGRLPHSLGVGGWLVLGLLLLCGPAIRAQENPLDSVHTPAPAAPPKTLEDKRPVVTGGDNAAALATTRRDARIRVEANLVLVPMTVTDPMNRLVTGLEKDNFQVYDNNQGQVIKSFSTQDAPLTIGIIFDLSGSMGSKFVRARKALSEFLRTSNPQDEFFVIGFNDRPALIVDFTSEVDDVEARMVTLKPQNRTALIDAIYLGVDKLKQAKYDRKALLVISDGGDNRSRYTENELRRAVRESDLQIYSIGIFDQYAPTTEEQLGPILLTDVCEMTGGRLFRVLDVADLSDIATRISAELRNEYVIGYRPANLKHDGNWRKLKVRLVPPAGLPPLTVHNRQGYYAPSE